MSEEQDKLVVEKAGFFDDVIKSRGEWCVFVEEFCKKCGIGEDFVLRLIGNGDLNVRLFKRGDRKRYKKPYVVIDNKSKRLLEHCGREIKEEWYEQQAREGAPEGEELYAFKRVYRKMGGGRVECVSVKELCVFLGVSAWSVGHYVNSGLLTGYKKGHKAGDGYRWVKERALYIVVDNYMEILFEYMGVICSGMTFEDCKRIMLKLGTTDRSKGALRGLLKEHLMNNKVEAP